MRTIIKYTQLTLLIMTAIVAILCYFSILKIKPDNLFVFFGAVGGICPLLLEYYSQEIKKFSTANVLAIGYVKNFLEPVMTQLIIDNPSKNPLPFYIYTPSQITGLSDNNIVFLKVALKAKSFTESSVLVDIPKQRSRNVAFFTDENGKSFYFDVATTLSALSALIDYKSEKKRNTLNTETKDYLFSQYVEIFQKEILNVLPGKLSDHVHFIHSEKDIE